MPTNTLDDRQSMNEDEWEAVKRAQIALYYRTPTSNPHRSTKDAPEGEKTGQTPPNGNRSTHKGKTPNGRGRGATIDDINLDDFMS